MTDSKCTEELKNSIVTYAINIIKASGCGVYSQFAATFNASISTAAASISAYLNLVRPIFALDKTIMNTFVIPPLNAIILASQRFSQNVIGPLDQIGASNNACPANAAVSDSVNTMGKSLSSKIKKARNKLDNMKKYEREDNIAEKKLTMAVDLLNDLKTLLPASCEDFKKMYASKF
jgi:hypothetical protein